MWGTDTRRVVELGADDEKVEDDFGGLRQPPLTVMNAHAIINNSSTHMDMTPTTRFLEHPVLLDMAKDGVSTGSSTTLPRRTGQDTGEHSAREVRARFGPLLQDELIEIRYRSPHLIRMVFAGVLGLVLGTLFNSFNLHFTWQWWIGLFGWLYLRTLECLALPLIFTSVTLCVAQLVRSSKGTSIMIRLALMFIVSAFLASGIGLFTGFAMSPIFTHKSAPSVGLPSVKIKMQCPNEMYMTSSPKLCDGKLMKDAAEFTVTNITGIALRYAYINNIVNQDVTYPTQIVDFFSTVFQQNITEAFTTGSYLGIIVFAIFIGAGKAVSRERHADVDQGPDILYHVLKQLYIVTEWILNYVIILIPMGNLDGMTFTIMAGTVLNDTFRQSIFLPIALSIALTLNFLLVVCVGYWAFVRKNPFTFLFYLLPALIYMLACQRTVATIPVMMRSIERSKQVSRTLAQFTVSLGTALSLCGTACFFTVACMFMVYTSHLESELTIGRVILLVVVSALSSFGTPEDTGAGLTYVATIWHTVFGSVPPTSFSFVVSMEWLMSRLRRVYNVVVVVFIARVIAEQLDETPEDDRDRAIEEEMIANGLAPRAGSNSI